MWQRQKARKGADFNIRSSASMRKGANCPVYRFVHNGIKRISDATGSGPTRYTSDHQDRISRSCNSRPLGNASSLTGHCIIFMHTLIQPIDTILCIRFRVPELACCRSDVLMQSCSLQWRKPDQYETISPEWVRCWLPASYSRKIMRVLVNSI